jgi:ribonuclease HI
MNTSYYVVHKGRVPAIYTSWSNCKKQIDKFEGAIFKKFTNKQDAELFLKNGFGENKKPRSVTRKENDDKKNNNKITDETIEDESDKIFIYTDGSCIKCKNNISKGGYGIYIPEKNLKIEAPLLNQKITNNRAEMTAIIDSLKYLDDNDLLKKLCIFTDSQYSMYIFNGTGERYEKNGYKKDDGSEVPNIDLIKKILELKKKYNIVLLKVRAHTDKKDKHSLGNEIADKLAQKGAMVQGTLTQGTLKDTLTQGTLTQGTLTQGTLTNDNIFIHKDIQMNELFDCEEGIKKDVKKSSKNPKLSNWFIKQP